MVQDMLVDLNSSAIDAAVHDTAVLKYLFKKDETTGKYKNLAISPYEFEKRNYEFALPEDSLYKEQLYQALLNARRSDE